MLSRFPDARIVAIDDTPANLQLIEAVLRRAGLRHIHTVQDPLVALDTIADVDPDLILLDLHMPKLDGLDLLPQIVQAAGGGYLPVLVLTADTTREAAHRALAAGARDFLTKPFDLTDVLLRVGNLLETRELHQRLRRVGADLASELRQVRRRDTLHQAARDAKRADITAVLARGGPDIVFQPIVDIDSGGHRGHEALSRFTGDRARTPHRWFADASEVGLGPDLELAAIRRALESVPLLGSGTFLTVNVSPQTILLPELADLITREVAPQLVLELTEHIPVEDYAPVLRALAPLRDIGVRLAVDDTGAGYASLRHILSLDPDLIKLDISLVRDIETDPVRRALVSALVAFARETGFKVIAEGVETAKELAVLGTLGVRWAQGFHLARPTALLCSPPHAPEGAGP